MSINGEGVIDSPWRWFLNGMTLGTDIKWLHVPQRSCLRFFSHQIIAALVSYEQLAEAF